MASPGWRREGPALYCRGMSTDRDTQKNVITKDRAKTDKPRLFKVLFHNDDYTTQEFVVDALTRFFNLDRTAATRVMLLVHRTGSGVAGVYSREVAETKVRQTTEYARSHGHPLLVTMEPE